MSIGALTACGDDGPDTAAPTPESDVSAEDAVEWLFVVGADAGEATESTLTLTSVDEDVVAFTDRPARQARRTPVQGLVSAWAEFGFGDDPPNAAIAVSRDGAQETYLVELTDPAIDADTLRFSYALIEDPGDALPAELGSVTVFIDGAPGDPVESPGVIAADAAVDMSVGDAGPQISISSTDAAGFNEVANEPGAAWSWAKEAVMCQVMRFGGDARLTPTWDAVLWAYPDYDDGFEFDVTANVDGQDYEFTVGAGGPYIRFTSTSLPIPRSSSAVVYIDLQVVDGDTLPGGTSEIDFACRFDPIDERPWPDAVCGAPGEF